MPDSGTVRVGRAFGELFTDDSKLVRGLRAAGDFNDAQDGARKAIKRAFPA